jgi:XisH protein
LPAKDRYHDTVKHALFKDGWTIVDEQVKVRIGRRRLWIDLRASKKPFGKVRQRVAGLDA